MENMRLLDIFINSIVIELTGALGKIGAVFKAAFSNGTNGAG
jgi:hypothetical protein